MQSISIDEVAEIIGVGRSRIEQWVSRGQFVPKMSTEQGKRRDWTVIDVIRLSVFVKLVDEISLRSNQAGALTAKDARDVAEDEASRLARGANYAFTDDQAFFVCYKTQPDHGWFYDIVRKRDIGDFLVSGCFIPKVLMSGHSEEARRHNSEKNTGPAKIAILINLNEIEEHVQASWPAK